MSCGIGAAVVRKIARQGAAVAFTYTNSETKANKLVSEIVRSGRKALALKTYSAIAAEVNFALLMIVKTFGSWIL